MNMSTRFARNRRDFLKTAAAGLPALAQSAPRKTKLGFDNFSLRAFGWKAPQLIDYAAAQQLDSLFITNLDALEKFDDAYLAEVKARARDRGVDLLLGSWSICPTSKAFRNNYGTAEEHLRLGLRLAKALGSPVFRCVLGTREDRKTDGGIEKRIEDTVKVCRAARGQALDAGVKIAIENHAGDMQAWELITLVEAAGKDYVGVTFDSGNVTWTLEDPVDSLAKLAPYVACTHIRDSMIWETEDGARVAWTAIGEGCTDAKAFFAALAELCPGVAVHADGNAPVARGFRRRQAEGARRRLREVPRPGPEGPRHPDLQARRWPGPPASRTRIPEGRTRAEPQVLQGSHRPGPQGLKPKPKVEQAGRAAPRQPAA